MIPEKLVKALYRSTDLRRLPDKQERELVQRALQNKFRAIGKENKHERAKCKDGEA